MAGDVAQLGLAVDSRQVAQGAKALDGLANSAQRAEAAADDMGASYANVGKRLSGAAGAAGLFLDKAGRLRNETGQFASAADKAAAAAAGLTADLNAQAAAANKAANANMKAAAAANDNGFKAGSHNVSNIAAQFQDIAVSAAGGMSAFQVGLQQGTQLAAVIGTMERPLIGLGQAFLSVLSPLSLVVIGFSTLAAAGIQMVNWAKVGAAALRGIADILPKISSAAAVAGSTLLVLASPVIVAAVVSLTAAMARLALATISAVGAFALANPFTAFILGATAAVTAIFVFNDEIKKAFGVDILGSLKGFANTAINLFIGAVGAIKAAWKLLPAALADVFYSATDFVKGGVEKLLNGVINLINAFILKVNAALEKLPDWAGGGKGASLGTIGPITFAPISNPYAGAAANMASSISDAFSSVQGTDWVGKIGGAVSSGASAAAAKARELADSLLQGKDKKSKGKSDAEKYDDIISAADRRIAQLKAEADGLGLTEEASARLRYETELLNQADQKGIDLSAAQRAELSAKAAAMAQVEIAAKNVKAAFDFAKDATNGFLSDLRTGLANGENIFKSFGNAALNVLNKIVDKLQSVAVDALFQSSGSGGGGLFGSILSGLGSIFTGGVSGSGGIGHAATGGLVRGPGSGTSDTAGVFALSNGEFVVNAAATARNRAVLEAMNSGRIGRMASGGYVGAPANTNRSAGGGAAPITIAPVYHVNSSGMQMSQDQLKAVLEQHQRDTVKKSVAAVEASRARVVRGNRT